MTGFDIAVLLLVGVMAITGFLRGFVEEMMALAAWALALFAIRFLHEPVSEFLQPHIGTSSGAGVLAFALLMLVPYATVKLLGRKMGGATKSSFLGPIDRVLGFGFGAVKGMIVAVLAFSVLALGFDTVWGSKGRPVWITQARTYPFVNAASEGLVKVIAERRRQALADDSKSLPLVQIKGNSVDSAYISRWFPPQRVPETGLCNREQRP